MRIPPRFHAALFVLMVTAHALAAEPPVDRIDVFKAGEAGYAHYRIPGIVTTSSGALLAYCEARASLGGDWGKTDLLVRRSTDGGKTWDAARSLAEPPKDARKNPVAVEQRLGAPDAITMNNPVAIAAPGGVVHVLYCVEYNRCFSMRSDDDGATFGPPREITAPTFDKFRERYSWRVLATGPGHGIRVTSSGRLIVPVWLSLGTGGHGHRPSCVATIYSDDAGDTWQAGEIVVGHPRLANPSESALAELSDGRVMLNVRHEGDPRGTAGAGGTTWRAVFVSEHGVAGWSEPRLDPALPDPVCMAGLLRSADGSLLFTNPANDKTRDRKNLTLRISRDDGKTWPVSRVIDAGTSGYSDLAATADGKTAFCFYERGRTARSRGVAALTLVRIPLSGEAAR